MAKKRAAVPEFRTGGLTLYYECPECHGELVSCFPEDLSDGGVPFCVDCECEMEYKGYTVMPQSE